VPLWVWQSNSGSQLGWASAFHCWRLPYRVTKLLNTCVNRSLIEFFCLLVVIRLLREVPCLCGQIDFTLRRITCFRSPVQQRHASETLQVVMVPPDSFYTQLAECMRPVPRSERLGVTRYRCKSCTVDPIFSHS